MSYSKLFSSITESSLWCDTKEVKILFITLLAKCDVNGFVEASIPGLAKLANLSLAETETALASLEGPDKYSKNPDADGRRLLRVDDGWTVINYEVYRSRKDEVSRKIYMRDYMKAWRKSRKHRVNNRKHSLARKLTCKPYADATATTDANAEEKSTPLTPHGGNGSELSPELLASMAEEAYEASEVPRPAAGKLRAPRTPKKFSGYTAAFDSFWSAYPRKVGKGGAWKAWLASGLTDPAPVVAVVESFAASPAWRKDGGQFIPHPATWLNQRRWEDEVPVNGGNGGQSGAPAATGGNGGNGGNGGLKTADRIGLEHKVEFLRAEIEKLEDDMNLTGGRTKERVEKWRELRAGIRATQTELYGVARE